MKYFITIVVIIAAIIFFSPEQVANRQIAVEKAKQEKLMEERMMRLKYEREVDEYMTERILNSFHREMADTLTMLK